MDKLGKGTIHDAVIGTLKINDIDINKVIDLSNKETASSFKMGMMFLIEYLKGIEKDI